jgi:hypothetical protein
MASSYSTSLRIQLINTGEQSGIWGDTTNTNWNLIQQSVAGVQSITMLNANYELTNLNGVSDEARNMVLFVGGTNSAIRQIITPLVQKVYVVYNNTTGGFAITIGGATGTLATVPSGASVLVFCDGTNFYSGISGSAGNFSIAGNSVVLGNQSVTGTSTLTGNTAVTGTFTATGALTTFGTASFTAGISNGSGGAGTILNVTAVASGTLYVGQKITSGATSNTYITALGTGSGNTGTYTVSPSQLVGSGTSMVGGVGAQTVTPVSGDSSNNIATTAYVQGLAGGLGTMSTQNANAVAITGGTIANLTAFNAAGTTTIGEKSTVANTTASVTAGISNGSGGAGTIFNVSAVTSGTIVIGSILSGSGVTANTTVISYGTGTGSTGTYNVSASQLVSAGTSISAVANTTVTYDVITQSVLYYTANAAANWTLNVRGDDSTTLNSIMAVGETRTITFLATQGATAYYQTAMTIDGVSVTPKWQGDAAPTDGYPSGIDVYVFSIIKTASATFTVLASLTQFA